ncbi:MAG: hypothetical protein CVU65_18465, partial [Deltaproteobacteria bacterium HGW-Deltaproteobacteria-22]
MDNQLMMQVQETQSTVQMLWLVAMERFNDCTGRTWSFFPVDHRKCFFPNLDKTKVENFVEALTKADEYALEFLRSWKQNPDMPAMVREDAHAMLTYGPFQYLRSKFKPKLKPWEMRPDTTRHAFQPTRLVRHREHRSTATSSRSV